MNYLSYKEQNQPAEITPEIPHPRGTNTAFTLHVSRRKNIPSWARWGSGDALGTSDREVVTHSQDHIHSAVLQGQPNTSSSKHTLLWKGPVLFNTGHVCKGYTYTYVSFLFRFVTQSRSKKAEHTSAPESFEAFCCSTICSAGFSAPEMEYLHWAMISSHEHLLSCWNSPKGRRLVLFYSSSS